MTDVDSAKGQPCVPRVPRSAGCRASTWCTQGIDSAGVPSRAGEPRRNLFRRREMILALRGTDADALALVIGDSLWRALEADVEHMEMKVSATSSWRPPATCLTCWPSPWSTPWPSAAVNLEIFRYAAGGFRDFPGSPTTR